MNKRLREYGIEIGTLTPGPLNSITDVPDVMVGHTTIIDDSQGCARTGVTAIVPHKGNCFRQKVEAAVHVINGYGKAVGLAQITELGCLEAPILLTNTLNVGLAADALVEYILLTNPAARSINPVVAECNDGRLNEIEKRFVRKEHVFHALKSAAGGPVSEGNVGGGTGMICYGYKGGIGTASRVIQYCGREYSVGVLVQANFGRPENLMIVGVPVGRMLPRPGCNESGDGSVVVIVATNAPLDARQLGRVARRASFGLARTGSVASHGSGDFVIAFSTTMQEQAGSTGLLERTRLANDGKIMSLLFQAVVESTEEAVYNALFAAEDMIGRSGIKVRALPVEEVVNLIRSTAANPK